MSPARRTRTPPQPSVYECLFRFFAGAVPGYCWLRLYPLPAERCLALLGAVPNFWYPSLLNQSLPLRSDKGVPQALEQ